jgi:mRNA-degrading endonuclease toxin of MazEF toxin-antitoxin module
LTDRQGPDAGPRPGDVIEFAFLSSHEAARGQVEASKDRRCVVVRVLDGGARVAVVPISSSEPEHAFKVALTAGAVGLTRPSWIVANEVNITDWPGHDLRPASAPAGQWWRYGALSDRRLAQLAAVLGRALKARLAAVTARA